MTLSVNGNEADGYGIHAGFNPDGDPYIAVSTYFDGEWVRDEIRIEDPAQNNSHEGRLIVSPIMYFKVVYSGESTGQIVFYFSRGGYLWTEIWRVSIEGSIFTEPYEPFNRPDAYGLMGVREWAPPTAGSAGCTMIYASQPGL